VSATFTMYGRMVLLLAYWNPDTFTPLDHTQICLCLDVPPSNASEDQLVEPATLDGYARIDYPMDAAHWPDSGFAELYNAEAFAFPHVDDDWGLIQGWAILDPVAGECLAVGGFAEPFFASLGMDPLIEAAGITLGLYD
jgi:hypothetical protein